MALYPAMLDLSGRLAVLFGSSPPADDKVGELVGLGAHVRVFTERPSARMLALNLAGTVEIELRRYRHGDLAGAWLAFVIPGDNEEQLADIAREAERRRIFLNAVDRPPLCTFLAASVVRRGDLTIAISTAGRAPALAVRLRQRFERELGPEVADFLELAGRLRTPLATAVPDFATRRERWYELVDSDVLELFARGEKEQAERRAAEILGVAPVESWR